MESVFELKANMPKQVVLAVNANDPLTVAMNPYLSSDMAYITVTRGENHILTITRKDGTTCSFSWGLNGYTLISDNLERLRSEVVKFIEQDCQISLC